MQRFMRVPREFFVSAIEYFAVARRLTGLLRGRLCNDL